MKTKSKKLLAVILSICMIMSFSSGVVYAEDTSAEPTVFANITKSEFYKGLSDFMNTLLNDIIIGSIAKIIPNFSFIKDANEPVSAENFYEGNTDFLDTETENTTWKIGYGSHSIVPDDFGVNFKYARGSYAPWGYSTDYYPDDEGGKETIMVRTIIVDDQTGRGSHVISSLDCIGISNTDVQKIRNAVSDFAKEKNIISMNVSSTHSHMSIDSQGVWNNPVSTIFKNYSTLLTRKDTSFGVNEDYLNAIIEGTKQSIIEAYSNMTEGTLSYSKINLPGYLGARTVSGTLDTNMYKLQFVPFDKEYKDIYIASFGCHAETTSYDAETDTRLSSDFVYYMDKLVKATGANFIFIQGNVGTNEALRSLPNDNLAISDNHISAQRIGYEFGYILLGMNMNRDERIALNSVTGDKLGIEQYGTQHGYTAWYDGLQTVEAKTIDSVMNVKMKQVRLKVDNSTALVLVKMGLASNSLAYDKQTHTYYSDTEIGYMEIGNALKVFLSPGEIYSEMVVGGSAMEGAEFMTFNEYFGGEADVCVCDLMNDAIGYVCPDNDYSVMGYKYIKETDEVFEDSWCMAVSMGKNTASKLMEEYVNLVDSVSVR